MTEDNCMKKLLDISVLIEEFESGKLDSAKTMRLIKDIVEAPVYPAGEWEMTPEEFLERCKRIYSREGDRVYEFENDWEAAHVMFDRLCWEALKDAGFEEGINYVLEYVKPVMRYA